MDALRSPARARIWQGLLPSLIDGILPRVALYPLNAMPNLALARVIEEGDSTEHWKGG
jgi:hypothetical protein